MSKMELNFVGNDQWSFRCGRLVLNGELRIEN